MCHHLLCWININLRYIHVLYQTYSDACDKQACLPAACCLSPIYSCVCELCLSSLLMFVVDVSLIVCLFSFQIPTLWYKGLHLWSRGTFGFLNWLTQLHQYKQNYRCKLVNRVHKICIPYITNLVFNSRGVITTLERVNTHNDYFTVMDI